MWFILSNCSCLFFNFVIECVFVSIFIQKSQLDAVVRQKGEQAKLENELLLKEHEESVQRLKVHIS